MAIRTYAPVTPARRGMTSRDTSKLTQSASHKALLKPKSTTTGRNHQGRITVRHRGGSLC